MGTTLSNLVKAIGIAKEAIIDVMKNEHDLLERRMDGKIQALANIYDEKEPLSSLKLVNETVGIEDNPVGTILTFMGKKAPSHYLICDGSEYKIDEFPVLAEFIKDQFDSYYYFGGSGSTFRVPDLRGEFLRMTGKHPDRHYIGGDVGIHQEPTYYMIVNPQLELFDQNERKIGVWVDDRPIYRSLKQFTVTITSENDHTHIFDISSLDADVIINYNGYCLSQTEDDMQSCFPISFVNSSTGVSNHTHSLSIGAYYKRVLKQLVLIIASDYIYRNNIFTTLNFMIFLDYVKKSIKIRGIGAKYSNSPKFV